MRCAVILLYRFCLIAQFIAMQVGHCLHAEVNVTLIIVPKLFTEFQMELTQLFICYEWCDCSVVVHLLST